MLEINNITVKFGKSTAIRDVSMTVEDDTVVGIIGANGAGKSTILNALLGMVPLADGEIVFNGEVISGLSTAQIVRKGIVLVPEGRQLFPYMSVLDNLKLGAAIRKDRNEISLNLERVFALFPKLKDRRTQKSGTLSGGEQQMVAIGRAIMAMPKLLCLDEPSLGLAPVVIEQLGIAIPEINEQGVSVLLVEQNVHLVFGASQKGYALQVGSIVQNGSINELQNSDTVKKAYLGG